MTDSRAPRVNSFVANLAWPGLASDHGNKLLALLYQLERSQWWSPVQLRRHQFRQLTHLMSHALHSVPHYRDHRQAWGIAERWKLTPQSFVAALPILTRAEVQHGGAAFYSTELPEAHGQTGDTFTSGSTGRPLKTKKSGLAELVWQAVTMRENLWHRDLRRKLAIIKIVDGAYGDYPAGGEYNNWGRFASQLFETGPSCLLHVSTKTHEQVEWLLRMAPDYIYTLPANAQALAQYCLAEGRVSGAAPGRHLLRPVAPRDARRLPRGLGRAGRRYL